MSTSSRILGIFPLSGMPWETADPFLFCVHHDDAYPHGNDVMGPNASLAGRNLGQDFAGKDGWRMYHGDDVPGFPAHPHRGFETVTIARRGYIDHSDSLGAKARFGGGDCQWMTAGKGIVHSEMFPLLKKDDDNPVELFQIWLNLPQKNKMVTPHFSMLWREEIPVVDVVDDAGKHTTVTLFAGSYDGRKAPPPPPSSWAADPKSDVAIWTIRLQPGAHFTLPAASAGLNRSLYLVGGGEARYDDVNLPMGHRLLVASDQPLPIEAGDEEVEVLLLQGRPIAEPIAQYGPFVMNTRAEIEQAFRDYQRTRFGGWPWPSSEPVHARTQGRFARHADGREEVREQKA